MKAFLSPRNLSAIAVVALLLAVICSAGLSAAQEQPGKTRSAPLWRDVEQGYAIARYPLGNQVLAAEVFLVRLDPRIFKLKVAVAKDFGLPQADVRTLTKKAGGLVGINANFFDQDIRPLGLLVADGQERNKMHRGGKLLTGVFYIDNGIPHMVHRDDFTSTEVDVALQAGPRLIVKGKPLKLSDTDGSSRRSGIAVTRSGEVILYATFLRFPGANLSQIQQMLLDPALDVTDAMNFDGGGSSQLFLEKNSLLADETFISGGDLVPVALVVSRR